MCFVTVPKMKCPSCRKVTTFLTESWGIKHKQQSEGKNSVSCWIAVATAAALLWYTNTIWTCFPIAQRQYASNQVCSFPVTGCQLPGENLLVKHLLELLPNIQLSSQKCLKKNMYKVNFSIKQKWILWWNKFTVQQYLQYTVCGQHGWQEGNKLGIKCLQISAQYFNDTLLWPN